MRERGAWSVERGNYVYRILRLNIKIGLPIRLYQTAQKIFQTQAIHNNNKNIFVNTFGVRRVLFGMCVRVYVYVYECEQDNLTFGISKSKQLPSNHPLYEKHDTLFGYTTTKIISKLV